MIEEYIDYIRYKLKEALDNKDFIGKIEAEVNVKHGGIVMMNISTRESVKI